MKHLIILLTTTHAIAHSEYFDQPGRSANFNQDGSFSASTEAGWFNRYISEGREAFGNAGMFTTLTSLSYNSFGIELWGGFADSSADREFEAHAHYAIPNAPLNLNVGLSYITDGRGGDEDWETSISIGDDLFLGIEWTAVLVYDFGDRSYLEAGISRIFHVAGFEAALGTHLGSNFNYVRDGHIGFDHYAIEFEISRQISETLTIRTAATSYTPIQKNAAKYTDDADLYNGVHFGIAAVVSF
jgi:hypothetical protein